MENEITEKEWQEAERHLKETIGKYSDLIGTSKANAVFHITFILQPIMLMYEEGVRTVKLYEMMTTAG